MLLAILKELSLCWQLLRQRFLLLTYLLRSQIRACGLSSVHPPCIVQSQTHPAICPTLMRLLVIEEDNPTSLRRKRRGLIAERLANVYVCRGGGSEAWFCLSHPFCSTIHPPSGWSCCVATYDLENLGGDENDDDDDDSTKLKKMALFENEGSIQLAKATQQVSEAPNMVAAILLC